MKIRLKDNSEDFWLPSDFSHRVYHIEFHTDELKKPHMMTVYKFVIRFKGGCFNTIDLLRGLSPSEFKTLFKILGYEEDTIERSKYV